LAIKAIDIVDLKKYIVTSTDGIPSLIFPRKEVKQFEKVVTEIRGKQDALMLDGKQKNLKIHSRHGVDYKYPKFWTHVLLGVNLF
jgi:hypothetical protein